MNLNPEKRKKCETVTIEIVVYEDGGSAISYFDRDKDGRGNYRGHDFRDSEETELILEALGIGHRKTV